MSGKSKQSVVVGFRIPMDVYETIQRRIDGPRGRWESPGHYLQERVIYDIRRRHGNTRKRRNTCLS
jgi:hypothetical protein